MLNSLKSTFLNVKHRVIDLFLSSSRKEVYHRVLLENNPYYKGLDISRKRSFIVRTHLFMVTTRFNSHKGFPVTLPMKIILSGAFVQITFGLNEDVLDYFNRIFIFSGPYSYNHTKELFKGDVNTYTKTVNLSWPAIALGYENYEDGINLALHEFAHCLILENSRRSYLDRILDEAHLREWKRQALILIPQVRAGQSETFRKYGGNNLMELFAVTLETFFERPDAFQRREPEFYHTMCLLLNQDPRYTPNPVLP